MRRQWALISVLAAILLLIGLPSTGAAQKSDRLPATAGKVRPSQLRSVAQFKDAFQNDAGKVRLVALISPT